MDSHTGGSVERRSSVIAYAVSVGLLLFLELTIFFPLTLFCGNQKEFTWGYLNLLKPIIVPALLFWGVLAIFVAFTPRRILPYILALLFGVGCAVYVQGNFLVWPYGIFSGEEIPWDHFVWQGNLDIGVWSAILLGSLLFARSLRAKAVSLSILLIVIQAAAVIVKVQQASVRWVVEQTAQPLNALFDLSPQKNVIFILLDTFLSPAFYEVLQDHPEYRETFKDFIYFRNTIGAFPTTSPSIPAILSGQTYDNSEPMAQFLERVLPSASMPAAFKEGGYQVDMTTLPHYCDHLHGNVCGGLPQFISLDAASAQRRESMELFDLTLFRVVPQFLKQRIYDQQNWFLQSFVQSRKGEANHVNSLNFADVFARSATTAATKPTFKFYHYFIPHLPLRLDSECNLTVKKRRGNKPAWQQFHEQARCALKIASGMVTKIKELDVYSQSTIVILGDHGGAITYPKKFEYSRMTRLLRTLPLLLVKPAGRDAPFQVSEVPAQLTDLPLTVTKMASVAGNFPGRSIFELTVDEPRERKFHMYAWNTKFWQAEFLPQMREYTVRGHAWNPDAWSEGPWGISPYGEKELEK